MECGESHPSLFLVEARLLMLPASLQHSYARARHLLPPLTLRLEPLPHSVAAAVQHRTFRLEERPEDVLWLETRAPQALPQGQLVPPRLAVP